jgi:ATP-binding protein involved in chromosome partitioning
VRANGHTVGLVDADLPRHRAVSVGGVENMSGQICPSCGETTELFPPAPAEESVWSLIPRLASVPFSAQAARDADQGLPVMVTGAVSEQVAAYRCLARELDQRIGGLDLTQYARERE